MLKPHFAKTSFALACFASTSIGLALPQNADELVLERGAPMALGDTLDFVRSYAVGDRGDWAAHVQSNFADGFRNTAIIYNGQEMLRRGDLMPGSNPFGIPLFAGIWSQLHITESGQLVLAGGVKDAQGFGYSVIVVDGEVVMITGQQAVDSSGAFAGTILSLGNPSLDAEGQLSATAIFSPGGFGAPTQVVTRDLTQPSSPIVFEVGTGTTYPNGNVVRGASGVWRQDSSLGLIYASEQTPNGNYLSTLRLDGALVLADGDPGPLPSTTWELATFLNPHQSFDVNDAGQVGILAQLRPNSLVQLIAVDGQLVAIEGQVMAFDGVSTLNQINRQSFNITETGVPIWSGYLNIGRFGFFAGEEPILLEGDPLLGSTLADAYLLSSVHYDPVSENGAFFVQWVQLADGREGLLRRELGVGSVYCSPAVANSSGSPARILATGSRTAGGEPLRLIATQLPANSFGLFFTGTAQASFTAPGSQGVVCIGGGGTTGRFRMALNSGAAGQFEFAVDTTRMPTSPQLAVQTGETWNFQAWFRDANPQVTSNLTDAISVTFD